MPDQFTLTAERLQLAVPEAEARVDSAIIAMASLITEVVTARGAIPCVPAAKGHATVHRIAKAQMATSGVRGDILHVQCHIVSTAPSTQRLALKTEKKNT